MNLLDIFLKKFGVKIGDYVSIHLNDGRMIKGIIMPKHMYSKEDILIINNAIMTVIISSILTSV